MEIKQIAVKDLREWNRNPRKHDVDRLVKSIEAFGFRAPLVVNETPKGYIVEAGHGRLKAAIQLGIKTVPCVVVNDDETTAAAYAIADNRMQELTAWEVPELKDLLQELDNGEIDMEAIGYTDAELEALMTQFHVPSEGLTDDDAVPDEAPPICQLGDLWLLGDHRLLCGDSTKAEDVARLMEGQKAELCFTSPPYNAGSYKLTGNVAKKDKSSRYRAGTTDDRPEDEYVQLLCVSTRVALEYCRVVAVNIQQLANNKFAVLRWAGTFAEHFIDRAIWYKGHGNPAMAANVMASRFEDIWLFSPKKRPNRAIETAHFRGTVENVVESVGASAENDNADSHAATMPMAVCLYAIGSWSASDDSILDPFLGSGSTLIACEKLGRKCYGMEIDPHYCDVIIKRWEDYTGRKAEKQQP